jgi:hypothetical protein
MKEKNRMKLLLLGAAVVVSVLGVAPARAFTMAQKCVIANQDCFPVRTSAGRLSPEQRIDQINDRLAYILGCETLRPENVRMKPTRDGEVEIWVGRSLLTTVTGADARANGAPGPAAVAGVWAKNLQVALPQARPAS